MNVAAAVVAPPHTDLLPVLEALVLVLLGGRLGGALFARLALPAVLGELGAGILVGNLGLLGWHHFDALPHQATLDTLGQIGVLFLLFDVGLHSNVGEMVAVGRSALLVATLGVVAPIALGGALSALAFPDRSLLSHAFVGATLCATSVGITARVLGDLGRLRSVEGRVILGAAVVDDVMGLVVLAVLTGIIAEGRMAAAGVLLIVTKAVLFLGGGVVLGRQLSRHVFRIAARIPGDGMLLTLALAFCFGLAWIAGAIGLAPIVGAFAAGLVLDEVHYRPLRSRDRAARDVPALLEPIAAFLVPVFFVVMGMRVDLRALGDPRALGFAAALTAVALASKQVCALGVLEPKADRLLVGLGMIPRGEVGLIFASIGAGLTLRGAPVVDPLQFSAVVLMVAATTIVTPPLLSWRLRRGESPPG